MNTNYILTSFIISDVMFNDLLPCLWVGGIGNKESTAILKVESSKLGMILANKGQHTSKLGFVLTSISLRLKSDSIMKSYPNISNVFIFLIGSILSATALNVSPTIALIYGLKSLSNLMSHSCN